MSGADDEVGIRAVIGRAALLGDEGAPEDYATVYTDDAEWSFGGSAQKGIDEIVAATRERRANGTSGPGTGTRHLVVPMAVDLDGDAATAVSYFLFLGDTTGSPQLKIFGTYRDELVRNGGGWKIRRRVAAAG